MQELFERINSTPIESIFIAIAGAFALLGPMSILALNLIFGGLDCFFGYFLFRVWMVLTGAVTFALLPISAWVWFDCHWGVILAGSLLMLPVGGYVFFKFYRVITATSWGIGAGALFVALTSFSLPGIAPLSTLPLGVNIAFGILLAVGIGILSYLLMRHLIIILSAIQGGCAIMGVAGITAALISAGPKGMLIAQALGGAVGITAAIFGIIVQYRLTARIYAPKTEDAKSKAAATRRPARKRTAA